MKRFAMMMVVSMMFACGGDENNAKKNNGQTSNNGTTGANNGTTGANNGTTGSNNGSTGNNGTTGGTTSGTTGGNLCLLVDCANPEPACDGTTAVNFVDAATCDPANGECTNGTEVREDCAINGQACDNGLCVDTCQANDPCVAPADSCAGTTLTSFSGPGMCDVGAGVCDYSAVTVITDCDAIQQVCQVDECVDLCENEMCTPPVGFCTGDIATNYSGDGMCDYLDGSCDYSGVEVITDCTLNGQTCLDGVCVGGTPVVPGIGDLVVTEIMPNPAAVADGSGEWFEIKNVSATPILLNDIVLSDDGSNMHTITGANDIVVNPGQYFVLGNNADVATNGGATVDYEYATFALSNSEDEIIITTAGGVVVDRIAFSATFGYSSGGAAQVNNLADLSATDNNDAQFWCAATSVYGDGDFGTPGSANGDCLPPAAVTIYDIQDDSKPNHPAVNTDVDVRGVVVTAKNGGLLWAQEVAGGPFSGIRLEGGTLPNALAANVGDMIDFTGTYTEDGSNSEVTLATLTVVATAGVVTTPALIDSAIFETPALAEQWEGVLVQINEAGVTQENPDAPSNFNETLLDGLIRIDDALTTFTQPVACSFFDKIVGPLDHSFGNFKIQPRDAADMPVSATPVSDKSADASAAVSIVGTAVGFSPKVLCVTAGTPVTFTNNDAIGHDAVSRNPHETAPNNFSLVNKLLPAILAPGANYIAAAVVESTEHYRCTPHPNMEGVLIILPTP